MELFRFLKKYLPHGIFGKTKDNAGNLPGDDNEEMNQDQRGFSRHWVSFPVIVSTQDSQGVESQYEMRHEKTVLKDISGGGALFVSENPDFYYPGQLLKISIMLDGTNDVRAQIRTEATVIRIHYGEKAGIQESDKQRAGIAVQFDRSFEFERIDNQ